MVTWYCTSTSVDGFISDQHDSLNWLFQWSGSAEQDKRYRRLIGQVGAIAMGSHTFEWILRDGQHAKGGERQPWPYPQPC